MRWDDGGRQVKLDQAEWIDVGPWSRDSACNVVAQSIRKGSYSLVGWLKPAG